MNLHLPPLHHLASSTKLKEKTRSMFVLATLKRPVEVPPFYFSQDLSATIIDRLNGQFANYVSNIGMRISIVVSILTTLR